MHLKQNHSPPEPALYAEPVADVRPKGLVVSASCPDVSGACVCACCSRGRNKIVQLQARLTRSAACAAQTLHCIAVHSVHLAQLTKAQAPQRTAAAAEAEGTTQTFRAPP